MPLSEIGFCPYTFQLIFSDLKASFQKIEFQSDQASSSSYQFIGDTRNKRID